MTIAELKELISKYPDDMLVMMSNVKERFQLDGSDIMYYVPETRNAYLVKESAKMDGRVCHKVLVLWAINDEL